MINPYLAPQLEINQLRPGLVVIQSSLDIMFILDYCHLSYGVTMVGSELFS